MVVNDPIADMLTRIRNAQIARHDARDDARQQHQEGDRQDPAGRRLYQSRLI